MWTDRMDEKTARGALQSLQDARNYERDKPRYRLSTGTYEDGEQWWGVYNPVVGCNEFFNVG